MGVLVGVGIGGYGWLTFQQELGHEALERKGRLVGIAQTIATGIDGDDFRAYTTPDDMERADFAAMHQWLSHVRTINGLAWVGAQFEPAPDNFAYVLDTDPAPLPIGYPTFDDLPAHRRAMAGETVYLPHAQDEWGEWEAALAPIRQADGDVVGFVEVVFDANARSLIRERRRNNLLLQLGFGMALALLLAVLFARFVNRHLKTLTRSALAVADGDLLQHVDLGRQDEIGVLADAFNTMTAGLRDREFIRETFGRFVDPEVVAHVLEDRSRVSVGGDERVVTVLMSDLRGFVAHSEEAGPANTVKLLNAYIHVMAEVVRAHRGTLSELLGDGLVVLFGAPTLGDDDALRACRCAVAMQRALAEFNVDRGLHLEMGIGICSGEVIAGNIGDQHHLKYGVVGPPINLAARLEGFTVGSQILISDRTRTLAGASVRVGKSTELSFKGRSEPMLCHEIVAVGDLAVPVVGPSHAVEVRWQARLYEVVAKQVSPVAHDATVVRASLQAFTVVTSWQPKLRTEVEVVVRRGDDDIANVFGAVQEVRDVDGGVELDLRLSGIARAAREALEAALASAPRSSP